MFNFITNSILILVQAVVLQTMPPKLDVIHIAKASSLNEAVLAVEIVPETQLSTIAYTENGGQDEAMDDFARSEGLNLNQTPKNGLDEVKQDPPKSEIVKMIKKHFPDEPLAVKIAFCESIGLRHYVNGEVLRGEQVKEDKGIFQINETYWLEKSKELGIDIYDLEGNIKMARYIYDTQGLSAWSASFKNCWKNL